MELEKERLYGQLKQYLAIRRHGIKSDKWYKVWRKIPAHARGITNTKNNRYYPVMWMPKLGIGWRRLKFREFESYYWE